jgi:hypothetical protein
MDEFHKLKNSQGFNLPPPLQGHCSCRHYFFISMLIYEEENNYNYTDYDLLNRSDPPDRASRRPGTGKRQLPGLL